MIPIHFYATSGWTVPILERLVQDPRFKIQAVVTKPQGSPIKIAAKKLGLPVFQFETLKNEDAYKQLYAKRSTLNADVAVVASFGQIIPQRILDLYPHGMINVHPSLLPKYRGPSPIIAPIKNGDTKTGVTIMKMDALMDHGPLLAQKEEPLYPNDTATTLEKRLAKLAADMLPDILFRYVNGEITPQEQDHEQATIVKFLSREDGLLDWTKPAGELERTVRAYDPWPGTYMMLNGKRVKIFHAALGPTTTLLPASRFITNEGYPAVTCANQTSLVLLSIQPEGKKSMDGRDFLRGHPWI